MVNVNNKACHDISLTTQNTMNQVRKQAASFITSTLFFFSLAEKQQPLTIAEDLFKPCWGCRSHEKKSKI